MHVCMHVCMYYLLPLCALQVKGEIETAGMSLITLRNCDAAVVTTKKAYQQACDQQSKLLGKMERANRDPTFTAKTKLTVMIIKER